MPLYQHTNLGNNESIISPQNCATLNLTPLTTLRTKAKGKRSLKNTSFWFFFHRKTIKILLLTNNSAKISKVCKVVNLKQLLKGVVDTVLVVRKNQRSRVWSITVCKKARVSLVRYRWCSRSIVDICQTSCLWTRKAGQLQRFQVKIHFQLSSSIIKDRNQVLLGTHLKRFAQLWDCIQIWQERTSANSTQSFQWPWKIRTIQSLIAWLIFQLQNFANSSNKMQQSTWVVNQNHWLLKNRKWM